MIDGVLFIEYLTKSFIESELLREDNHDYIHSDAARDPSTLLLTAIDLGRLWQGTRAKHDIRALIAPILGQIEGGETAPDIRNARTLLAELV